MIIWITSYPRSGNTMYRMLLYQLYGINTYSAHNDPEMFAEGFAEMVGHTKLPVNSRHVYDYSKRRDKKVKAMIESDRLYMLKIHRPKNELPFPAPSMYIVRDGRDALVSFAHLIEHTYPNRRFEDTLEDLVRRKAKWGQHVMSYHGGPCVRYEDMLKDPIGTASASMAALGLTHPLKSGVEVPTFEKLHIQCPWFFRKGKVGSWRKEMPRELQDVFWRRFGDAMTAYGYER